MLRFRFSPRDAKVWPYVIRSDVAGLDGQSGQFTAAPPPAERTRRPSARHPNWWIDDPDPAAAEGVHPGAKNVSRWREEFLRDFAARLSRTGAPAQAQGAIRWGAAVLRQKPEWYATPEARGLADSVMQYQAADGGWPKNTDLGVPPPSAESRAAAGADVTWSTIDNNGTTMPMQFLALMTHATGEARYRASFLRGFDYLLAAQYPNGGWPQFFPLRPGYYTHVTFNDNAMVNVLTVLRDAAAGERALRLRRRGPPDESARGRVPRHRHHPEDPGEAGRKADGLVRAARREDPRAGVGARLRAAVAVRQRERRHRALPDGDRAGRLRRSSPPSRGPSAG